MKKSLVALAALAATSAFAQTTVEIYGRAHVALDTTYKTTGGTTTPWGQAIANTNGAGASAAANAAAVAAGTEYDLANRRRVADDGSRIGIRVREELSGGAYARAVIETGVNLDTNSQNGQSGQVNTGTGWFGSRDAYVGLGNAMGEIRLGRQNNWWGNGAIEDVGANRIHFSINGAYTAPSSGFISGPGSRWDNTLKFVANKGLAGAFEGSEVWIATPNAAEQAVPNNATAATAALGNPKGGAAAKASGITLKLAQGPWNFQYDWAVNANRANGTTAGLGTRTGTMGSGNDATPTYAAAPTADNDLIGQKFGAAFKYAEGSKLYFINTQLQQKFAASAYQGVDGVIIISQAAGSTPTALNTTTPVTIFGGNRKQSSNLLGVQHRIGAWELHAAYAKQGNVKIGGETVEDTGSKAYTLGARYELSKRTALTVATTQIKNDRANNINNSGGGQSSVAYSATDGSIGYGAKLTQMGASIMHNF